MALTPTNGEHPLDVFHQIQAWNASGTACALVIVTQTEGGAVRAPGALLAVSDGASMGYISGGCIDADVVLQARQSLIDETPKQLRYGTGSPFVDLPLPCGGAIEVLIIPNPDPDTIASLHRTLTSRLAARLALCANGQITDKLDAIEAGRFDWSFTYDPKLRLRIAGRGTDALTLARISEAAGYSAHLQLIDEDDVIAAQAAGLPCIETLETPNSLPLPEDDPWTAFVLLFHDRDWETPLLKQALAGKAFYIGAVGSHRTHANRCDTLRAAGCSEADIVRIHAPIGMVPSLRDASMLAISTLSEIVDKFTRNNRIVTETTALILLAAGRSQRFERGDKLLAKHEDKPVLEHAANLRRAFPCAHAVAVTGTRDIEREEILRKAGWSVLHNPDADLGQSTSLRQAIESISKSPEIEQVIVILGDMPNVSAGHLRRLMQRARDNSISAIFSDRDGVTLPPALFKRRAFAALKAVDGDRGAKSVFDALNDGRCTIPISPEEARDIDRVSDLTPGQEIEHA